METQQIELADILESEDWEKKLTLINFIDTIQFSFAGEKVIPENIKNPDIGKFLGDNPKNFEGVLFFVITSNWKKAFTKTCEKIMSINPGLVVYLFVGSMIPTLSERSIHLKFETFKLHCELKNISSIFKN